MDEDRAKEETDSPIYGQRQAAQPASDAGGLCGRGESGPMRVAPFQGETAEKIGATAPVPGTGLRPQVG